MRIPTSGEPPRSAVQAREDISALTVVSDGICLSRAISLAQSGTSAKLRTGDRRIPSPRFRVFPITASLVSARMRRTPWKKKSTACGTKSYREDQRAIPIQIGIAASCRLADGTGDPGCGLWLRRFSPVCTLLMAFLVIAFPASCAAPAGPKFHTLDQAGSMILCWNHCCAPIRSRPLSVIAAAQVFFVWLSTCFSFSFCRLCLPLPLGLLADSCCRCDSGCRHVRGRAGAGCDKSGSEARSTRVGQICNVGQVSPCRQLLQAD